MIRETVELNEREEKEEIELTPDEVMDLLTNCCDNGGMS
jgi:hypothetical protein